ncbi:E3 ubiquitin-protein ligase TRAIP-like [Chironomus tepperi]|uniref:E3 ubiquitin-protein ligase TRAIP-like n=1 Tax=Chironomus tepperi TaxID=113505 RepID=UPI00391FC964
MSSECCICSELLLKSGLKVSSTPCGHVYHTKCLKEWTEKNNNKGICPVCRTNFDPSKAVPLHSLDDNETKAIDAIYDYVKHLEKRDAESRSLMEFVVDSLNNLTTTVTEMKNDNAELKQKITKMEEGGFLGGHPAADQLKAKDGIIVGLKKEIQELKSQRAEAAKQMLEIQHQIGELKKKNVKARNEEHVLQNSNSENQMPTALTLSLKFDDISDRMILGEF